MTNVEWKEYKVTDLFKAKRGTRLTIQNRINGEIPLVTAGFENTGITNYISNKEQEVFPPETITIDMFGNCFYRGYKYCADDNIISLNNDGIKDKLILLYISASINRALKGRYSYGKQFRLGELEKLSVKLPYVSDGTPDYGFMADHVRKIQADHVRKIQAYLEVTGFNNIELTEEEREALSLDVEWGEYRLGDLLTFKAIKQAKSQKDIPTDWSENGVTYVVQSISNNMVSRKVNKEWLIKNNEAPVAGNKIALGVTLPAVSYQPEEFGASQVITGEAEWLNKYTGEYIVTIMSKMMYRFSYGTKPGLQIYKDMVVQLPSLPDGSPDFVFMENYIRATQKQVIKNLVAWNAKELEAYKEVIG